MESKKPKEKKGFHISAEDVVKVATQTVAGTSAGIVAYYALKAATPPFLHPIEKIAFKIGGVVVEGLVYSAAAKHVGDTLDANIKAVDLLDEKLKEAKASEEETEETTETVKKNRKQRRLEQRQARKLEKQIEKNMDKELGFA